MWAPIALEPPVSGGKVNEVERVKALSKKFIVYAFFLVSLRNLGKRRTYVREWFKDVGPIVTVLPWLNVYGVQLLSGLASGTVVALTLVLLKLGRGVDLVISRGCVASLPLVLVCKLIGVRVLYNVLSVPFAHTESELTGGRLMQNRVFAYMIRLADYFVLQTADYVGVATRASAQDLIAVFGTGHQGKTVLLPFPVPDEFFGYPLDITRRGDIMLVYSGSLSGLYEFSHLIGAIEKMTSAGQHVSLVIYCSQQGRRMFKASPRTSFLAFKDQVPKRELIDALRQATAVVIPTSNRVKRILPIKAIEAMALGVPVIISNPREPEIFRDGDTCIVVHEDSAEGWQEAIERAATPERRERIVRGARAKAEVFRSIRNLSVVSSLLRNRHGSRSSS
jgi:glycosyltransferase involved in cell wall biosynthesis